MSEPDPPAEPESESDARAAAFVRRWANSGAAERANSQPFLTGLCDVLGVPRPDPQVPDEADNAYVFEKTVTRYSGDDATPNFVDLYKAGCFVLESKQGADAPAGPKPLSDSKAGAKRKSGTAKRGTGAWEKAMRKARNQAERYAKLVPDWPPFLVVCDVGACLDLYADFSGTGKHYRPFAEVVPDRTSNRIALAELTDSAVRAGLRAVWVDPHSLDPAKRSAAATRDLAAKLAELAKRLEHGDGPHAPREPAEVAGFLMRCLFTMFCEDVGLLPDASFTDLLEGFKDDPDPFPDAAERLWADMDAGANYSGVTGGRVRHFNGSLFKDRTALPLSSDGVTLLWEAARADWTGVEPAIFGTLLERALDPAERHKLGAHYTPRAYVERLVLPTVVEPLRIRLTVSCFGICLPVPAPPEAADVDAVRACAVSRSEGHRDDAPHAGRRGVVRSGAVRTHGRQRRCVPTSSCLARPGRRKDCRRDVGKRGVLAERRHVAVRTAPVGHPKRHRLPGPPVRRRVVRLRRAGPAVHGGVLSAQRFAEGRRRHAQDVQGSVL